VKEQAQARLDLAANVIAGSNEAIIITDPTPEIVDVNQAFCEITGYSREEVLGKNPSMMASGRHDENFQREFWETLVGTGHWKGEVWARKIFGALP